VVVVVKVECKITSGLPWSHILIYRRSGARTRSKTTTSLSRFQWVQVLPVLMSYEEVMLETLMTCLLNPRVTWQLSWIWVATWKRWWCRHVQCGNVLIIKSFRIPLSICFNSFVSSFHMLSHVYCCYEIYVLPYCYASYIMFSCF
jgi:hypothetical protein